MRFAGCGTIDKESLPMKCCSRCGHLEENKDYCRICGQCLTYDPPLTPEQAAQAQEPPLNRYKLLSVLKQISVPAAGLAVSLVIMGLYWLTAGRILLPCAVGSVLLGAVSLVIGLLEWPLTQRKAGQADACKKAGQRVQQIKIFLALGAVLLAGAACAL